MIDHVEFDEAVFMQDERAQKDSGDMQGLVPFFIMCVILLVAFVFFLVTGW